MPNENKEEFTVSEEIKVEITAPIEQQEPAPTTERKSPIIRYNAVPLKENHGMTTEANRFRSS